MVISTVDTNGQPESRTVLLKEIYEGGFVFYTNYDSNKAKQIAQIRKFRFYSYGRKAKDRLESME